nr:sucrase ferredoxin [Nocardioides luti]
MAGSAPTETDWLLVEHPGPWGRKAVAESNLADEVREHLAGLEGVRVQLIRRHGGVSGPGVRVFRAHLDPAGTGTTVETAVLADAAELLGDVAWQPYDGHLWLVCTNGRRDVCCAELGRPVAGALSARWHEETWETTHLGGHRFSGTLLALPSGVALGRLDADTAVAACHDLALGQVPIAHSRGRAGAAPAAQVAELHLRTELGLTGLDEVAVGSVADEDGTSVVTLHASGTAYDVRVGGRASEPRRQSCADLATKPGRAYDVTQWVRHEG